MNADLDSRVLTLPNALTALRVAAIPVFLVSLEGGRHDVALCVFLAAGITDAVDGALARITESYTKFGAVMDPLADKLLMASAFLMLAWYGAMPAWLTILVLGRDLVILAGFAVLSLLSQPIEVHPSALGKLNTFLQLTTVGMVLVALARPDISMSEVNAAIAYVTGASTAASGVQYVHMGIRWRQAHPLAPPGGAAGA